MEEWPRAASLRGPCHSLGAAAYILVGVTSMGGAASLSSEPGGLPFSPAVCVFKDCPSPPGKNQGPSTDSLECRYGHSQLKRQSCLVRRAWRGSSITNLLCDLEQELGLSLPICNVGRLRLVTSDLSPCSDSDCIQPTPHPHLLNQ